MSHEVAPPYLVGKGGVRGGGKGGMGGGGGCIGDEGDPPNSQELCS